MVLLILGIVVILSALLVSSLLFTGIIKLGSKKKKKKESITNPSPINMPKKECGPEGNNYINPMTFKTGFVENSPQPTANMCSRDDKFRYSINLPFVNYGLPEISNDCQCTEFIQAP